MTDPLAKTATKYTKDANSNAATLINFDDDGDFRMQSGVLFRQQRRVQLSRIQTVDVTQPFAARLFSMAVVVIEVAGQDDSRVRLKYVSLDDAREIRREVLARSAGLSSTTTEAPQSDGMQIHSAKCSAYRGSPYLDAVA